MTHGSILIVNADARSTREVARVARAAAAGADVVFSSGDVPEGPFDVVLFAPDTFGADARAALFDRFQAEHVILHAAPTNREALACVLEQPCFSAMLAPTATTRDLLVTLRKRLTGEIFGIEKYFPWGTPIVEVAARASSGRDDVLAQTVAFAERAGLRSRLAEMLATVCDELFNNALYDAPVDSDRKPRSAHLKRANPVELLAGEQVHVRLCCDGEVVGCSVVDPFGALELSTVKEYLARCLRCGTDQISDRSGGAGLGLFTVLEASSHLVFNLAPGRRTEVISLIDVDTAFRGLSERPKSICGFRA